jgi:HPt (histidine-containing phosphotransfer) domain-containing protein
MSMIIDTRVIRASIGDDPSFVREVAADLLSSAEAEIENIAQAARDKDVDRIWRAAHSIKGATAIFGAIELRDACLELETAARDMNWRLISPLVSKLTLGLADVSRAIEDYLERLSAQF